MNLMNCANAGRRRCALVLWVVAVSGLGSANLVAAEAVLTLDAAVARALAEAPQLLASRATVEAAQQSMAGAGRLPDPELILGVDNLPVTSADRFSLNRDFMTMRKVGVMQAVPNRIKRNLQTDLAVREADAAEAQFKASRFDTARAAADAWITVAVAAHSLQQLRALREDLDVQSGAARAALSSNRIGAAEAMEGESALARLDARILDLEQQLGIARAELARWVGQAAALSPGELPWRRELEEAIDAISDVSSHAPLAPAESEVSLARARVALARAEKRPDWSAELSFADRGPGYSDMVSLQFRVGLPLFTRHRQNPLIAARLADARAQEAHLESALRMHRAEIDAALAAWRLGRARLAHFQSVLLPLAEDRFRVLSAGYGSGGGSLRAVLDALGERADLEVESTQLAGEVTRAWVFLHLLHGEGETP